LQKYGQVTATLKSRISSEAFKKPTIPVEFKLLGGGYIQVMCLLDSGSDVIVLPKGLAELLGLKLSDKIEKSKGIGGEVEVRTSKLNFRLKRDHDYYSFDNVDIQVVDTDDVPVILGRRGFFERFKITIDEKNEKVILKENKEEF